MRTLVIDRVIGIDDVEVLQDIAELVKIYNNHRGKNAIKDKYYEGHIRLRDVNLGIALPKEFDGLEIGCEWGSKCVDVLAARSMFDGFVGANGNDVSELQEIVRANRLVQEYMKACRDELKFGCTFATLSADQEKGCRIRFHSPQTASAIWDGEKGRIKAGLAIIDSKKDESDTAYRPSMVNIYTDTDIWVLKRVDKDWFAQRHFHTMGRPLMEPMIWNATSAKPFGRSRIKESVRRLIEGYVRTIANATIGLEFATAPQKYLLGLSNEQYDKMYETKFTQYIGNILMSTQGDDGSTPTFGQLTQGSIEPHVQMIRVLATQFSAATGLSVTDTGVVNDANPTSSDAILAQTQTLVGLAEQLNEGNGEALEIIAKMALAISKNTDITGLSDEDKDVVAHFQNPAMPSIASTADAATKIASTREHFSNTDTYLEMVGFDQADVRRINAQESRARGAIILSEEFGDED